VAFEEFIKDFIAESVETLARLDQDFVEIERDPSDRERLDRIYGGLHTIKGTAGFFAFSKLETVAHSGESLLSCVIDGKLQVTSEVVSALLAVVDAIREMLGLIEATGKDGDNAHEDLVERLCLLRKGGSCDGMAPAANDAFPENREFEVRELSDKAPAPEPGLASGAGKRAGIDEQCKAPAPAVAETPAPTATGKAQGADSDSARQAAAEPPIGDAPVGDDDSGEAPQTEDGGAAHGRETERGSGEGGPGQPSRGMGGGTIRVSVELLDKLMSLVGELVLARNQVLQFAANVEDRTTAHAFQQLSLITTELQQAVMKTRMQPIANIFNKFPRVVRDLALSCEKAVELTLEGEETELDKSLLEAVNGPLTHIVRNAIDHGIERPATRLSGGKAESGHLRLCAAHESGHVTIEITDDGGGVDVEKVRRKALEKRLITAEQSRAMSEEEVIRLIFTPGFSTTDKVTHLSGRGVGMDVVRTSLEKIGGTVDVTTRLGRGTTIKLKIPLTLAIIPALIISSGRERYAIPQVNLREAVHLTGKESERVELIHDTPVFRLRGRLLPLVDLGYELGMAQKRDHSLPGTTVNIVVLNVDGREFGLIVDRIADTQEIVVKPINKLVKGRSCFAGATIMDDGRPALILDVLGVARRSRVLAADLDRGVFDASIERATATERRESVLVFDLAGYGRMAMPLSKVGRLELFQHSRIEAIGGRQVIQYREDVMPLVSVSSLLGSGGVDALSERADGVLNVIVYNHGRYRVGLVVSEIVDIVEDKIELKARSTRHGVQGTVVVRGKVTELLDPDALLCDANIGIRLEENPSANEPG